MIIVLGFVLGSISLYALNSPGEHPDSPKAQKWEYVSTRDWQDSHLNDFGSRGWELCGTYVAPEGQSPGVVVIFKRPKQ